MWYIGQERDRVCVLCLQMASTSAVSLLQSIQEGLAKLTAEVDNMESKIVVGSNEVSAC